MTARIVLIVSLLMLLGGVAAAQQPPPTRQPPPGALQLENPDGQPRTGLFKVDPPADRDRREGSGKGMALLFWAFALVAVGGSVFVISRRNLIAAVMGMVGTFFGVAALYMMLYAHFLAVIQVLVYAGAIMVLFVFVVMILNKPEDEPWAVVGLPGKALAALAMLYLTVRLGSTLWSVKPPQEALTAPKPVSVLVAKDPRTGIEKTRTYDFGSTGAVGSNLFGDYLFPFEAISILLLVSVVGAIAVARPLKDDEPGVETEEAAS